MPLDSREQQLLATIAAREEALARTLREIVEINSVSDNVAGASLVLDRFDTSLREAGFVVERHASSRPRYPVSADLGLPGTAFEEHGVQLVARLAAIDPAAPRVLILGHADTVYAPESPFQHYERRGDAAVGPGIVDMKGGLVVALAALTGLAASSAPRPSITFAINSDEEVNSNTSRALFTALAQGERPDLCVVLEPGIRRNDGSEELVVERKGHASISVGVYGTACHASKPESGVSAVHDLAQKIVTLLPLQTLFPGTSLNVGVLRVAPDATFNTVARYAEAEIDLRFDTVESGQALIAAVTRAVQMPLTNGAQQTITRVEVPFFAPAMPRAANWEALRDAVQSVADAIGYGRHFVAVKRPGRSDANIVANLGVPAIDGLGIVGQGSHVAFGEVAEITSLIPRSQLLALLLCRFERWRR